MIGLVGKKVGMTRIFTEEGISVPVTVIKLEENRVIQVKKRETDGYTAIQVTTGVQRSQRMTKPQAGHFIKSGTSAGRGLWEFRLPEVTSFNVGQSVNIDVLLHAKKVDISGTSKGKGFSGTVKRWNFRTQDSTHGNSLSHRVPGSIGQNQTPGKVFKGKKMAGQMGNQRVTIQNLKIIQIDIDQNLLLVKGAVPGATGSDLIIKQAVKG
ncbi:50S ribosomal protein L3 [Candidatus Erwinia haradaeae]|uniref:Large ribosomal subunit protein uL3 n=1 Tax=Candidatus Erwinia haradaeae TaxID=1922217 RepID=A0A451DCK4_9GAMM|nr:50S ribosomal protein L3 [Candidatus Erwinia haradaeae]VFP84173.1 50S ribosomal protein L3 [Candidatus Erwinia haradaeae]